MSKHKRRAKKLNAQSYPYTQQQVKTRISAFNQRCAYCDEPATSIDHIISLKAGGADALYNLVPACQRCNSSKRDRNVEQWFTKQSFYTFERWQKILRVVGQGDAF